VDDEAMTRLRQAISRIARQLNNTATDRGLQYQVIRWRTRIGRGGRG
jgi:hypothetical protein